MFKPLFLFITGASGAGKTTLLKAIAKKLDANAVSIHYFDSIGVPNTEDMIKEYGSREKWQEMMANIWIQKLSKINDKKLIFLEGQFNPDFVVQPLKRLNIENYLIICLCVDRDLREHRLVELRKQPELVNTEMDRWAAFLKKKTIEVGGMLV